MAERRADDATREVNAWLKCEYLQDHVGDEFDGVIAAVTSFGLFVELVDIYIEGLVHITALPGDYYNFDAPGSGLLVSAAAAASSWEARCGCRSRGWTWMTAKSTWSCWIRKPPQKAKGGSGGGKPAKTSRPRKGGKQPSGSRKKEDSRTG